MVGGPAAAVEGMRGFYDSRVTQSVKWRLRQLAALDRLLADNEPALRRALDADLAKPATESYVTEIGVVRAEIRHLSRNLRGWLAPRRVRVPLAYRPARAEVVLEPLGVMLIIAPWNYPVQLLLSPLAGALAAGNTVVLKPSELAPEVSRVVAELVPRYLEGVTVVEGAVAETTELLEQRFDHIVYTGGARVARIVMTAAARHLTPVTLELGGKSPAWVDTSSDLASAARRLAWGKLVNAGQTCVAPDYIITTPEVAERLVPLLTRAVRDMYGKEPRTSKDYGRIVSTEHARRVVGLLDETMAAGGRVVLGGEHDVAKRYIAPTIVTDVATDVGLMSEEIFGPVLPIVTVADLDAAVDHITAGDKPLAMYAFTNDARTRERLLADTSSGALAFDAPLMHVSLPTLPFGGVGDSGMGAYHGEASVRAFSHERSVLRKPPVPDTLAAVRPPFTALKRFLARRLL